MATIDATVTRISELTNLGAAPDNDDEYPIVDTSAGSTKAITAGYARRYHVHQSTATEAITANDIRLQANNRFRIVTSISFACSRYDGALIPTSDHRHERSR